MTGGLEPLQKPQVQWTLNLGKDVSRLLGLLQFLWQVPAAATSGFQRTLLRGRAPHENDLFVFRLSSPLQLQRSRSSSEGKRQSSSRFCYETCFYHVLRPLEAMFH